MPSTTKRSHNKLVLNWRRDLWLIGVVGEGLDILKISFDLLLTLICSTKHLSVILRNIYNRVNASNQILPLNIFKCDLDPQRNYTELCVKIGINRFIKLMTRWNNDRVVNSRQLLSFHCANWINLVLREKLLVVSDGPHLSPRPFFAGRSWLVSLVQRRDLVLWITAPCGYSKSKSQYYIGRRMDMDVTQGIFIVICGLVTRH